MIDKQIKLIPDGWRLYGVDMSIEGRAAVQLQGPSFGDSKCHDYISATEPTLGGAILTARLIAANTYRGWTISEGRWPEPAWHATGPNYDAWTEGEGEWCDNGEKADAPTRAALITEIDARIEELADAAPDLSALSIADVLEALAVRCEAATGADRELAKDIYRALFVVPVLSPESHGYGWREDGSGWWCQTGEDQRVPRQRIDPPNWLASFDAAMSLVPEGCLFATRTLWDGPIVAGYAHVSTYSYDAEECDSKRHLDDYTAIAATPALALVAASLRARASLAREQSA